VARCGTLLDPNITSGVHDGTTHSGLLDLERVRLAKSSPLGKSIWTP
jgi:hypothetical protein